MIPVDKGILNWISKNGMTALVIILFAGNVYQWIDNRNFKESARQEIRSVYEDAIKYERDRSTKLENLLIKKLPKKPPSDEEYGDN